MDKELLIRMKEYIEFQEEAHEEEYGCGRNLKQIIADGDMPDLYNKVLKEIEKL
jgi:hypothetical protein